MNKQGWDVKKLGDCFTFIRNGANIKQFTHAKGFPITRIETLSNDKFNRDKLGYADIFDIQKYNKYILESNDILMSHINSTKYLGRAVLYSKNFNETIIHGMNLLCLRACETIINPGYIIHYFRSFDFKDQIAQITKKAVNQASFTVSGLQSFTIPVPPLSIQNQIVKELDTLQAIITKKKAQLIELDKLAQATFYEMFGDPVENEKGWNVHKLKLFGNISTGNTPSRKEKRYYENSYIEWIKTDNITNNLVISKAREHLSEAGYKVARSVKNGAILVTCIAGSLNSIGRSALTDREVCFNQQINAIQPNDNVNSIFLYWLFKISATYIQQNTPGVLKFILSKTNFEKLTFIRPPPPIQNQFAKRIEAIEKQKALINQSISETELLFDSAMDNYFN